MSGLALTRTEAIAAEPHDQALRYLQALEES